MKRGGDVNRVYIKGEYSQSVKKILEWIVIGRNRLKIIHLWSKIEGNQDFQLVKMTRLIPRM